MPRFWSLSKDEGRRFVFAAFVLALFLLVGAIAPSSAGSPEVNSPVALALRTTAVFEEPLVPTGTTSLDEDHALSRTIAIYKTQTVPDDFTVFDQFLAQYPRSSWRVALFTNLGL